MLSRSCISMHTTTKDTSDNLQVSLPKLNIKCIYVYACVQTSIYVYLCHSARLEVGPCLEFFSYLSILLNVGRLTVRTLWCESYRNQIQISWCKKIRLTYAKWKDTGIVYRIGLKSVGTKATRTRWVAGTASTPERSPAVATLSPSVFPWTLLIALFL